MDREEMIKQLVEMGFKAEDFEGAKDELLADMLRLSEGEEEETEEHAEEEEDGEHEEHAEDEHEDMSDEAIDAMPEEKKAEKLREYRDMVKKYDEAAEVHPEKKEEKPMEKYSEKRLNEMVDRAVAKSIEKHAGKAVAKVEKFAEEAASQQKRAALEKFVEANMAPGIAKIEPWEMDETSGSPTILDRLMACDASTPVFKFSEKGKTFTKTQLEIEMEAIEARPAKKFGEKIVAGKDKAAEKFAEEQETAEIHKQVEKFSEHLPKGSSVDSIVAGYKAAKKHNPGLRVEEFVGA